MIEMLKKRREDSEEGFTLIELMVVVLIIAILIAIAIPTFLGAQDRARDRSAQSNLRNALTAAKTLATDHEGFFLNSADSPITNADMEFLEPSLTFGSAAVGVVETTTAALGASIVLATKSGSDTFFAICSDSDGNVTYAKGATEPTSCADTKW